MTASTPELIAHPITHLLYLHGFRSSPASTKARMVCAHLARTQPQVKVWCPQLPPSPQEALELVLEGTANWPSEGMAVIGSSLGGFYATIVSQARHCRAALLNPAVDPARDLAKYIGEHSSWHNAEETFFFRAEFVDQLRAMTLGALPAPELIYALIAQGDEVLDWREMLARYANCRMRVLPGSDHAISHFELVLDEVMREIGL
jgi:hypothetical protein